MSNKITRLDFAMGNAGVTLSEDATFDIDNVKIYTATDERFWQLKSENEGNIFGDVDSFLLSFSGEMDETTLSPETIKLYDSENNEIEYSGGYDANAWEYSITPNQKLTNGGYKVFVDTENVNGVRSDKSIIYGMSEECEKEADFIVFSGDLPEVRNLKLSGKNIPGHEIKATGDFYHEGGLEGYVKYQWWYSDSENGEYQKIDGQNTDTFIPCDGFYDKYIKVSAIAVSNDDVIRGEEIFSDCVEPTGKPIVKNLSITGKNINGESLRVTGEAYQEDGLDSELRYQWWYSVNRGGEYTKIENETADTFVITENFMDKYIKASAIAVSDIAGQGEVVFTEVICPQSKPYAQNVTISGIAVEGMEAVLEYVFGDDNNDSEGQSIFEWFISDTGTGDWEKLEGQKSSSYTLTKDDIGKYIKAQVTPVSTEEPYTGSAVGSAVFGPITSLESINLVGNSGFEDGTTTGWNVNRMGGDNANVEATQEEAYTGQWCGRFSGQTQNSTFMTYGVRLESGVRYLETCMMKVAPDSSLDNVNIVFYGEGNQKVTYKYMDQAVINKKDWSRVSQLISVETGGLFSQMPQYWANGTAGYVAYIDDFYVAPLIVKDISAQVPESIKIPTSGEVSADLKIFAIHNQVETTLGLEGEKAYWAVDDEVKGVYVKGDKLYVTSEAVSGTLNLKALCEPQFDGAVQSKFTKNYSIELITNDNKTPRIVSAELVGDTSEKSTLKLSYDFYQVDGCEDVSEIKWYASDTVNGQYREVQSGGTTFEITDEYIGFYIKAEVIPVDGEGRTGQSVNSNVSGPKTAPTAKDVEISGKGYVGEVITSQYTYYDFNGDKEGATKFQWMRAASEKGEYEEIAGATAETYTVSKDDIDSWIKLRITPVSEKKPYTGNEVMSNAVKGPRPPRAEDVTINVSGKVFTGKYKYVSDNGVAEGNTTCKWLIDGKVVRTGVRYEADFTGTKTVEFMVTPVAVTEPYSGESVSVKKTITFKSSNTGSGGGGGGGGGSSSGVIQSAYAYNTLLPQQTAQTENTQLISDIEGHWSKIYAEEAVKKGIMEVDAGKKFYPEKNVTRAEMITYIFRAMKYTETDYRNEFNDVASSDKFAKMLQTMVDKGVISKDSNFRPNDNVTRQEVCKILSIALGFTESEVDLTKYTDNLLIADWAVPYVRNIIKSNLMTGVSDTEFSPITNITNGQIAKIVYMIHSGAYNKPEVG